MGEWAGSWTSEASGKYLCGLKCHMVEICRDVTLVNEGQRECEYRSRIRNKDPCNDLLVRSPRMLSRFSLLLRDWTPVEFQLPVEGANKILCSNQIRKALWSNSQSGYYLGNKFVLQRLLIDGLNNRTGHSHIISGNSVQQGFKPAECCLYVRV